MFVWEVGTLEYFRVILGHSMASLSHSGGRVTQRDVVHRPRTAM